MNGDDTTRLSRRTFLTASGGVALGVGIGRLSGVTPAFAADALPPLPWAAHYPKNGLDAAAVRELGYNLYYLEGGCAHASFHALVDSLAARLALDNPESNPWLLLPRGLFKYSGGGINGWGTICGILNATMAVFDLLGVHSQLGHALFDYYCNTALPTTALNAYKPPAGVAAPLPTHMAVAAGSPLCHNSMSMWAAAAGVPVSHPSAKDRDGKLVGDLVYRAAELLNDRFMNAITPAAWTPPDSYAHCYTCHTQSTMVPSQTGRMDCTGCHNVSPAHGYNRRGRTTSTAAPKGQQMSKRR